MKKLVFTLYFLFSSLFLAQIINVPLDQPTIQAGIDVAENGDTVLVAEGTYFENVWIENKNVILASHYLLDNDTNHISKTIINGSQPTNKDDATTVTFFMSADTSVLCGLTITGGYGKKLPNTIVRIGGGIASVGSNLIIRNNIVVDNWITYEKVQEAFSDAYGGGINITPYGVENLKVIIRNNVISNNRVRASWTSGAGINIQQSAVKNFNYLIENNIISNNITTNIQSWKAMGGGIYLDFYIPSEGERIIRNNIIKNNQALSTTALSEKYAFGGGIYIVMIETISGGWVDKDPGPFIYNNIISGNHSDYYGGGISVWRAYFPNGSPPARPLTSTGHYSPKPSFINNTIVNNTALDGAGFFIMNHKPFLMNNILWNQYPESAKWGEIFLGNVPHWTENVEGNKYGDAIMYNNNIQGGWSGNNGDENIDSDPIFSMADSLYRLSEDSPCIGTGKDSINMEDNCYYCPSMDILGNVRPNPIDMLVDIGANESEFGQVVGIKEDLRELPIEFSLEQNYPNPFNPTTTIKYQIPDQARDVNSSNLTSVHLNVFDLLGREVTTLINQKQKPGNYEVNWDANKQPSGIYFYQLKAGNYTETRKMILIK